MPRDGREEYLFNTVDVSKVIESQKIKLRERVQGIPGNTLLNASEYDLEQALVEGFRLDVPVLKDGERYLAHSGEAQVNVTGDPRFAGRIGGGAVYAAVNENVIAVPFEGEADFFKIQPNRFGSAPPHAQIGDGELLLRYVRTDHDAEAVKRESTQTIKEIKDYLGWLREAVEPFNRQLEEQARMQVKARKDKLLADAKMAEAIGLPMKKREGVPVTYAVPVKKRVARIEEIRVQGAFRPEPALAMTDYEEILRIMKNMALVMERSPREFAGMGEETLRSHFLVQLNGELAMSKFRNSRSCSQRAASSERWILDIGARSTLFMVIPFETIIAGGSRRPRSWLHLKGAVARSGMHFRSRKGMREENNELSARTPSRSLPVSMIIPFLSSQLRLPRFRDRLL